MDIAYFNLGQVYKSKNDTKMANKCFNKAVALNPDLVETFPDLNAYKGNDLSLFQQKVEAMKK